jgi:hypothetical protein
MELGDVVYVMVLKPHGEVRGVKDGGKDVGIVDRVIGNNIVEVGAGRIARRDWTGMMECR